MRTNTEIMTEDIAPTELTTQLLDLVAGDGRMNERIEVMEHHMLQCEQVEIPVREWFVNGMYAREVVVPAGTLVTGRVHKRAHLLVMSEGDALIATPQGVVRMKGPMTMEGLPGRKIAGYAFTDVRWLSIDRSDSPDMAGALDDVTVVSMREFLALSHAERDKLPAEVWAAPETETEKDQCPQLLQL